MSDEKEKLQELLDQVGVLVEKEQAYREQYKVGDRFRTIPNQLKRIYDDLKTELDEFETPEQSAPVPVEMKNLQLVYVYLFNAQGKSLQRWNNMLSSMRVREYGINRPVYGELTQIDAFIASKVDTEQHAYLSIVVNKANILAMEIPKEDFLGQPLLKLKEGALSSDKIKRFNHNGKEYQLRDGRLVDL